jgi:hypothetical protein
MSNLKEISQRWLRAVYTGDVSVVDELAADNVAITYPIFNRLFGTPTLRGKEAVRQFIERFVTRWGEGKIVYHEAIEEVNRVALMWSFEARNIGPLGPDQPATNEIESWGGITIIRFDKDGRVIAEIGEESGPGPFARFTTNQRER